jgi:hypothetical protein
MKTQGEWVDKPLLRQAMKTAQRITPGATRTGSKTARTPKATNNVGRYSSDAA